MRVRELYDRLEERIPRTLSCEWDNDGLMCCPCGDKQVEKVLVALDVTGEVVRYAIDGGYDVIISHHPFIYKGLKTVNDEGYVSAKLISLIGAGISVMSFHTRLDAVEGGVNDCLAKLLSLEDIEPFDWEGVPLGRVGTLAVELDAQAFACAVKSALQAPFVLLSDAGVKCSRVAVVGGSGKDVIGAARAVGADTFVSGRLDYHLMTDAPDIKAEPLNLIEAGHFYSEDPVCEVLKAFVLEIAPSLKCDVYCSNVIKAI